MNVNEAVILADQIESLISNAEKYNKTKNQILDELLDVSNSLRNFADQLDADMYNELGAAYEKYDDAMVGA
jgi:NTP pyrophosphatase (non-canonical NTP hydrolase)